MPGQNPVHIAQARFIAYNPLPPRDPCEALGRPGSSLKRGHKLESGELVLYDSFVGKDIQIQL